MITIFDLKFQIDEHEKWNTTRIHNYGDKIVVQPILLGYNYMTHSSLSLVEPLTHHKKAVFVQHIMARNKTGLLEESRERIKQSQTKE